MSASLADRKWLALGQDGANDPKATPPACHPILGSKGRVRPSFRLQRLRHDRQNDA
jgi:hypothetical protein